MGDSKVAKRCAKCGAMMYNVSVARKYCDFCRFGYATNDPVLPLEHPKYTGPTLQEIMREATKEGLQYAEYCKKHGLRNDCRASMYRSTIENCAIFKNILETQGIRL